MNILFSSPRRLTPWLPLGAVALLSLEASASQALAQTMITSVPYTISSAGKYQLANNVTNSSTSTPAITISVPNVILDLNEFFVSGAGNTASSNSVIYVADVADITIKNGIVANDATGIYFTGSANPRNYLVQNVSFTHCYLDGIYVYSAAPGSILSNCSFSNLGNSTKTGPTNPAAMYSNGGWRMEANIISNVTPTNSGTSYGLNAYTGDFCINNTISNCGIGIANGKYINNLTNGCTTPFTGGTNATGNN
jgi:hypothetical protein